MPTWFRQDGCKIIAEVAQAHDGSLGAAHSYIEAIAKTGADAVKFQTHIANAESTPAEPWRVKFSLQDETRYDYWVRTGFTEAQWFGLAQHARERGITFLSSAFSIEAVDLLDRLKLPMWKVGAGEVTNLPLIEYMARTRRPVLLSSGMSSWAELDAAVAAVRAHGAPVAVFQCTTVYPCPAEKIGLNVLREIRERYQCPAGLSDHSGTIFAGLAAAALGADMIEVHVTFSRECFGPDVAASLTVTELTELVKGVRFIEAALANPVEKDAIAHELTEVKRIFGKSVVAARDLQAGRKLSADDLAVKKPGTGIPAARFSHVINCTLRRPLVKNSQLAEEDLERYEAS